MVAPTAGVAVKRDSDGRAYGGCCREVEIPMVAPAAGVAVKRDSDGRAYGGYCREKGFRWSESLFTLSVLC